MADRYDYFFRQKVTESELDDGFAALERADRAQNTDLGLVGIAANSVVTEHAGIPDLTVDISGSSVVYDKDGERVAWGPVQTVDVSVDEGSVSTAVSVPGNEKIVSVFAKFTRVLSDPRIDGNSVTVYFNQAEGFEFVVRQGAEGPPPATPPALDATHILLADIRRSFGQTQIFNTDITGPTGTYTGIADRREDMFRYSAGVYEVAVGTAEESDLALLALLNAHITGANAHPATAIDYSGGGAWLDGTTNPAATVEVQLDKIVTDLTDQTAVNSGANKLGLAPRAAWLGGRTNPATDIWTGTDKIIQDLNDQAAGDDGAERIGAEAHTSSGSFGTVALGSVRSQLNDIIDQAVNIGTTNAMTNAVPFTFSQAVNTLRATAGELNLESDLGDVLLKVETSGQRFAVRNATDDILTMFSTASSTNQTLVVGNDTGIADAYAAVTTAHQIVGGNNGGANEAAGLHLQAGDSASGQTASFMRFKSGTAGASAGDSRGPFIYDYNVNEGNDEREVIIPLMSAFVADGNTQQLTVNAGGAAVLTNTLKNSSVSLIEVKCFAVGDTGAGGARDAFGVFQRRAVLRRTAAGSYALIGSSDTVGTDRYDFDDSGSAPDVEIVSSVVGAQVEVTSASGLSSEDAVWWGVMKITAFTHTDVPDI